MLFIEGHSFAAATLIALIPAAVSWLSGRRLARRLDDPLLAERLMRHYRRNGMAIGCAFVACMVADANALPLTLPLLISGTVAAAYPLRRVMFGERWSFGAYLSFHHRLMAGLFGPWIGICALPYAASIGGSADWVIGAAAAAGLLAWHHYSSDILRRLLRCTPLEDRPLLTRCRELASACGLPQPQ